MEPLEWGQAVGGFRLSASLDKTTFSPCEPIRVSLVFRNVEKEPRPYTAQGADFDYDIDCRTVSGEPVALTAFGSRMKENRGHGRRAEGQLPPNGQLVSELLLGRHVDLSLGAKYTVTISRSVALGDRTSAMVVANSLAFEVRE